MDLRQTPEYARFLELEGWTIKNNGPNFVYLKKIPLTPFSILKFQRPHEPDFKKLLSLARENRVIKIFLEPAFDREPQRVLKLLKKNGFHPVGRPFLPTKSLRIDLTRSLEKTLGQTKKETRYSIRKAVQKGVRIQRIRKAKDLKIFYDSWKEAESGKYPPAKVLNCPGFLNLLSPNPPLSIRSLRHLFEAFGDKAVFLIAGQGKNRPVAGAITLLSNDSAHYYRAFTSKKGRKCFAQYLIVWESIREAKKAGGSIFDLEGIYDPRFPARNWKGFSRFKKSFGGQKTEYPGCFLKNVSSRPRKEA